MQMKNVLIIDDDVLFGKSLKTELEDNELNATYIENPAKDLAELSGDFDLALIDLRLKNSIGLNYIEEIKDKFPHAFVVIMTGYGTIATAVEAMKQGADDYLTKPITLKKIQNLFNETEVQISEDTLSLDRMEREYIEHVLVQENGNITRAAEKLGLHRQSLQRKLRKWVPLK
jgi:two-component system response regulator RegA